MQIVKLIIKLKIINISKKKYFLAFKLENN